MAIQKITLSKKVNGTRHYVYPKTSTDMVILDDGSTLKSKLQTMDTAISNAANPDYSNTYLGINATAANASKVNNHTVESDVPSGAVFTDTTYGLSISGHTVSLVAGGSNASVTIPDNDTTYTIDSSVSQNSNNPVSSGAVYNAIENAITAAINASY